jgi:hypothetical protein
MSVEEKDPREPVKEMEARTEEHLKEVDTDPERVDKRIHDAGEKAKRMYKLDGD